MVDFSLIQKYMSDTPLSKVYYTVAIKYDNNVEEVKDCINTHSDPLETYTSATTLAHKLAESIADSIGCVPLELSPEENVLGEYYYVINDMEEVAATITITAYDYGRIRIN